MARQPKTQSYVGGIAYHGHEKSESVAEVDPRRAREELPPPPSTRGPAIRAHHGTISLAAGPIGREVDHSGEGERDG
jgi:hypothetical protein